MGSRLRPKLARDEALSALWADLAHVCRLGRRQTRSPIGASGWLTLRDRAEWLTALHLAAVRFEGPETDLTIGLMPGVRWERAEMTTPRRYRIRAEPADRGGLHDP